MSSTTTDPDTNPGTVTEPEVYQGQFGTFTIDDADRREVVTYRGGLAIAALCFALGTLGILWLGPLPWVLRTMTVLYTVLWLALGVSLATIHIYLKPLHRLLQIFWLVGGVASLVVAHGFPEPFVQTVYQHPETLWGVGFTFAALTGIFFKEGFCFNRLETKLLTPLVPALLLGHLAGVGTETLKLPLLALWAAAFAVFALRKVIQPIPPDIGDKSVFVYLAQQQSQPSSP
jgi:uncharacterized integral membrane protein